MLYESREECTRHAEKEAEEHEYVDADGQRCGIDGLGLSGYNSGTIGQCNELAEKRDSLRAIIRKKDLASLDKKRRGYRREEASLVVGIA